MSNFILLIIVVGVVWIGWGEYDKYRQAPAVTEAKPPLPVRQTQHTKPKKKSKPVQKRPVKNKVVVETSHNPFEQGD